MILNVRGRWGGSNVRARLALELSNVRAQGGCSNVRHSNVRAPVLTLEQFIKNIIQILIQSLTFRLNPIILFLYEKANPQSLELPGLIVILFSTL
jgi:hypothetical protein